MAYLDNISENYVNDIIKRKEFARNVATNKDNTNLDTDIHISKKLTLRSYQNFAEHYMSPNSPVKRVYVKYGTGTGKTLLSINVALKFIDIYKQEREVDPRATVPGIIIIGFTKNIFKREILKYPEFGYVSREELDYVNRLKAIADSGTLDDEAKYNEYLIMLKRRITNKRRDGFFQFYGYREFVNRLFITHSDLDVDESEIHKKIKSGDIQINTELLDSMKNSLIICDEIHNVYNSCDKNNWGIALQVLLNYHKYDIRAMFLSATPINHSPSEVVDLLNLLSIDKQYTKNEFFISDDHGDCVIDKNKEETILQKIGNAFIGKVLFLEDANPKYFPTSEMQGEKIPNIDILKFIRCPMNKKGLATYREIYTGTLPQDARYIMDFILPNPDSQLGLYKTQEVKNVYQNVDKQWLDDNQIQISIDKLSMIISGEFLNIKNLPNVSTKYHKMMTDILQHINGGGGKLFIYHKYVKMSGILFIKEILLRNGILDEYSEPTDNTLDSITGLTMIEHKNKKIKTPYSPCRFILIHSDIDMNVRDRSVERYNNPNNAYGQDIKILLGADVIKESYDIKCVSMLMIMSRPDNISTLLQIFGRAKRQFSHRDLPPDMRTVIYRIYVTSIPGGELSYEEKKYKERIEDYKIVQKIERLIHINAADAFINYDIIKNTFVKEGELGILPFTPKFQYFGEPIKWTHTAYYNEQEISDVIYIIKRLFIETSSVFKLQDLIKLILDPPFSREFNSSIIDNDNILIAIDRLSVPVFENVDQQEQKYMEIDKLFDPNDKIILKQGVQYCITKLDDYYILSPLVDNIVNLYPESPYRINNKLKNISININDYLSSNLNESSYLYRKEKYYRVYANENLKGIINAICDYTVDFHIAFIEEIIHIIFTLLTEKKTNLDDHKISDNMLKFYIKMLYYYDLFDIIMFYNNSRDYIRKTYELKCEKCTNKNAIQMSIEHTLSHSSCKWCPDVVKISYYQNIENLYNSIQSKGPINGDILPIGYFIDQSPKFYHPNKGWYPAAEYSRGNDKFQENDIIIGFHQKSKTGLRIKFKIRQPIHKQNMSSDTRKLEKGTFCVTKSKGELLEILQKLGLEIDSKANTAIICEEIRARLMYLEIQERKKGTSIKYFYQYWETQPI